MTHATPNAPDDDLPDSKGPPIVLGAMGSGKTVRLVSQAYAAAIASGTPLITIDPHRTRTHGLPEGPEGRAA